MTTQISKLLQLNKFSIKLKLKDWAYKQIFFFFTFTQCFMLTYIHNMYMYISIFLNQICHATKANPKGAHACNKQNLI